jgi:hypothetical protein
MEKKYSNIKKFDIAIYERTLYICTGASKEEMNKRFICSIDPYEFEQVDACSFTGVMKHDKDICVYVAWFSSDNAKTANIQAHEAVHVADSIYKNLGIHHDVANNEPYAYLVGFIVECINKTRL